MFEKLQEKLFLVCENLELAIESSNNIFEALVLEDFDKLKKLNIVQSDLAKKLNFSKEKLADYVINSCKERRIETNKIQDLIKDFDVEQKEKIITIQKKIIKNQSLLREALFQNQEYFKGIMGFRKMMKSSVVETNKKENNGKNILLDESF